MASRRGVTGARIRRRGILALIGIAVVAGIAATAIGAWVDRSWPNPVYGMHVIALAVALLFVLVGLAAVRHGQFGRSILAASLGSLLGVVIGMSVFGAPDPRHSIGSMRLTLDQPFAMTSTGEVACVEEGDQLSAWAEFEDPPTEGMDVLHVSVEQGYPPGDAALARPDRRAVWISLASADGDGPWGLSAVATQDTVLAGSVGGHGGSLRFAKLFAEPNPPGAASLGGREFSGSMEWTCSSGG